MKLSKLYSKSLWKDSFLYAVSFIAAIETICAIANFSITDICNIQKWWEKGLVIVGVFLLFWITTVQRNYPIGSVDLNRNHSSDVLV